MMLLLSRILLCSTKLMKEQITRERMHIVWPTTADVRGSFEVRVVVMTPIYVPLPPYRVITGTFVSFAGLGWW